MLAVQKCVCVPIRTVAAAVSMCARHRVVFLIFEMSPTIVMGVPPPGKGRPNHPRNQQEHFRARSSLQCVQVARKPTVGGSLLGFIIGVCRSGLSEHVAQWCIPLLGGEWLWSCFSGPFSIDLGGPLQPNGSGAVFWSV